MSCSLRGPLRFLFNSSHLVDARREQKADANASCWRFFHPSEQQVVHVTQVVHAPQRPHPRFIRQPHRCNAAAARPAAATATTTGNHRRRQPQPRTLLDRRQLRASRAATGLRERGLREARRGAGEPRELPQAEEATDEGEDINRELAVAQRQRRISYCMTALRCARGGGGGLRHAFLLARGWLLLHLVEGRRASAAGRLWEGAAAAGLY
jgi:hypothetical protein